MYPVRIIQKAEMKLTAFTFITETWMPQNGYRPNVSAPAFIYYDERFRW
jgi:hypothetical protein